MRQERPLGWLGRLGGGRRRSAVARPMLVASRDLPPVDAQGRPALPSSPEPLSEEALRFARHGAARSARTRGEAERPAVPSIASGADLRALLEGVERASGIRQSLEQAAKARTALDAHLDQDCERKAAAPGLRLVTPEAHKPATPARPPAGNARREVDAALTAALDRLRRISEPGWR